MNAANATATESPTPNCFTVGNGRPRHRRGLTDVPGLYFLGLSWQHTRGSALIGWVKDDAKFLAAKNVAFQRQAAPESDMRKSEAARARAAATTEGA